MYVFVVSISRSHEISYRYQNISDHVSNKDSLPYLYFNIEFHVTHVTRVSIPKVDVNKNFKVQISSTDPTGFIHQM